VADRTLAAEVAKLVNDPSVDVQIALGFNLSSFPETQDAAIALARRAGSQPMVRDALLSGLRGRELEVLEVLIGGNDAAAAPEMLGALSAAVMNERRTTRVEKLARLIAAQPANGPAQLAMLEGASGKNAPKGAPKFKLLYLGGELPELAKLASTADAKAKPLVAALDTRIAWPNKPGVPPPPVITPLTAAEQKLFETGKQVYTTLCTACHQPNGQGMDGLAPTLVDSDWVLGDSTVLPGLSSTA
jgi:mono/diheme cytochrome c family protein